MATLPEAFAQAKEYHRAGQLPLAEQIYREILQVDPACAEVYYLLGALCHALGKLADAVANLQRAVKLAPSHAGAHHYLGVVLAQQKDLDGAIASFQQTLILEPESADARRNLRNAMAAKENDQGVLLAQEGKSAEAIACYRRALEIWPEMAEAHSNLGVAQREQGNTSGAVACYQEAVRLKPDDVELQNKLAKSLEVLGRLAEAKALYRRILQAKPHQPLYELRLAALCPTVFQNNEEIDQYRSTLLAELRRLAGVGVRIDLASIADLRIEPPFNLPFQGRNDRILKEAYADIFGKALLAETPTPPAGFPRIGLVVTRKHEEIFLRSLRGVIERLNPALFECVIVCAQRSCEIIRSHIKNQSIRILGVANRLDQMVSTLRDARFDVLYFWEVATDTENYLLPFFRLAPVQCTSWGIQVTTGIPQMDYYLSSALVEPEDAADHYTEKLLLATTLLTYQERSAAPKSPKRREDFGFRSDQNLYLCAQHLGKFHPDFDPLLAAILRRDAKGLIVATADQEGHVAQRVRDRFAATMPDVADRVVFLPRQPVPAYLSLIAESDVLLDPLHFGGVNSTYDGFSLNKPIVTLPSQYHRGRYTFGCYRKMGISECVASDQQQYVEIAIALGTDASFREKISQKIRRASGVLFEDRDAVSEHERLFSTLIAEARCGRRTT